MSRRVRNGTPFPQRENPRDRKETPVIARKSPLRSKLVSPSWQTGLRRPSDTMSTSSESSWSSEDETGQHDVAELETSEAGGNVEECSVRGHLSSCNRVHPWRSADPTFQRNCRVCFDLDIPSHLYRTLWENDKKLNLDASAHSVFFRGDLSIRLVLLESTAKAGCTSCELLLKILRTRPDMEDYIGMDRSSQRGIRISSQRYTILQSNVIVIHSMSSLFAPGICFYIKPGKPVPRPSQTTKRL